MNYGQVTSPNWNGGKGSYIQNFQQPSYADSYNYTTPQVTQPSVQQDQTQSFMRTSIPGRLVNSLEEVAPGEVPMDGTPIFFPKADGSLIYVASLNKEGRIATTTYIRQEQVAQNQQFQTGGLDNQAVSAIMERLDKMQKEIKRISRPRKRFYNNQNNSKEVRKDV